MATAIISPAMLHDGSTLFTFKEAMGWLRCSRSTLYRLMWSGEITGHKVGSTWRFLEKDLHGAFKQTPYMPTKKLA